MSGPLSDEEKERLDNVRRELDLERQRFTGAAVKSGQEKASLEVFNIVESHSDRGASPGESHQGNPGESDHESLNYEGFWNIS